MKFSRLQGYILVALASLILGSNGIIARFIDLPTPVLIFYRYFLGTIILSIFLIAKNKKLSLPKTHLKEIFLFGILNTLLTVLAFYAFTHTSIANAEILLYAYPIYVVILAPVLLKEKIERSTMINLGIAFIGLILLASPGSVSSFSQNSIGILAGFAAGVIYALYVLAAKIMRSKYGGLELNLYLMAISVLLLFPFLFIFHYQLDVFKIILLVVMGLFHSALALSLYFIGIKTVKAQHVGIISYCEPLSAIFFALIFLAEIPTLYTIFGGGLILYSGYKIMSKQK